MLYAFDKRITPATFSTLLILWATAKEKVGMCRCFKPSRYAWSQDWRLSLQATLKRTKVVAKLARKPIACQKLRLLQARRLCTAVEFSSFRAICRVRRSIKTTRHNVVATPRTHMRNRSVERRCDKASTPRITSIKSIEVLEWNHTIATSVIKYENDRSPNSSQKACPRHAPHCGEFKAGQILFKRSWARYCKPISSKNRTGSLNSIRNKEDNPPNQLSIRKRAARSRCCVGAMSHSKTADPPASALLAIRKQTR